MSNISAEVTCSHAVVSPSGWQRRAVGEMYFWRQQKHFVLGNDVDDPAAKTRGRVTGVEVRVTFGDRGSSKCDKGDEGDKAGGKDLSTPEESVRQELSSALEPSRTASIGQYCGFPWDLRVQISRRFTWTPVGME